jgi:hypothetical protein
MRTPGIAKSGEQRDGVFGAEDFKHDEGELSRRWASHSGSESETCIVSESVRRGKGIESRGSVLELWGSVRQHLVSEVEQVMSPTISEDIVASRSSGISM